MSYTSETVIAIKQASVVWDVEGGQMPRLCEKLYDSFLGIVLELDFSKLETFEGRHPE